MLDAQGIITMEPVTLEVVANLLPWLPIIILTSFAAVWFHLRAGTSYGLLNRLYAIVIGGKEFHDDSVTEFWNERKDIERFNALFNIRAKSLKEINRFIKWLNINDLDLRKLANLNDLFDMEKMEVKKGPYFIATHLLLCATLFFALLSTFLVNLAGKDAALVKFSDEAQWIWLNHDAAYSTNYNPFRDNAQNWRLTVKTCSQAPLNPESLSKRTQLKPENINNICESFSNKEDIQRVTEIIESQTSFVWLALVFTLLSIYLFKVALQMNTARKANDYLKKKLNDTTNGDQSIDSESTNKHH